MSVGKVLQNAILRSLTIASASHSAAFLVLISYTARYYHKSAVVFTQSTCYTCPILAESEMC